MQISFACWKSICPQTESQSAPRNQRMPPEVGRIVVQMVGVTAMILEFAVTKIQFALDIKDGSSERGRFVVHELTAMF